MIIPLHTGTVTCHWPEATEVSRKPYQRGVAHWVHRTTHLGAGISGNNALDILTAHRPLWHKIEHTGIRDSLGQSLSLRTAGGDRQVGAVMEDTLTLLQGAPCPCLWPCLHLMEGPSVSLWWWPHCSVLSIFCFFFQAQSTNWGLH